MDQAEIIQKASAKSLIQRVRDRDRDRQGQDLSKERLKSEHRTSGISKKEMLKWRKGFLEGIV